MAEPTAVYRVYDTADALLYIGISSQPRVRWQQHANEKAWWRDVARKDVTWYDGRETAAAAEMHAVVAEAPVYNVIKPPQKMPAKTVRLPKDLYQRLRRAAFDRNESQNDIIVAALVTELRRLEREGK